MAWTRYQMFLAITMVITGSLNTLFVKFSDKQIVVGDDGSARQFNHPFMQSSFMFLGEALCLLVFNMVFLYLSRRRDNSEENHSLTKGARDFNPFLFLLPAICDMMSTTVMYIGLNLTYASSFQMLRGSVIVFTGILSVGFLDRKLGSREWSGIALAIVGLSLVGGSDLMLGDKSDVYVNSVLTGDLLIICAQIITGMQMVVEEKFVSGRDIPPLQAVGWEGVFGFVVMSIFLIPLNFIPASFPFADNPRGTAEDTVDAFVQIGNSVPLLIATIGIILSIAFFNFAGISITKEMSATSRMILDSVRTIIIWAFSLSVKWQDFHYLQLIGFILLLLGMACYNNLVVPQLIRKCQSRLGRHRVERSDTIRVLNAAVDGIDENQ